MDPFNKAKAEPSIWMGSAFWDDVEYEIEEFSWADFSDFLEADRLPFEPRPEFREKQRELIRAFAKQRQS